MKIKILLVIMFLLVPFAAYSDSIPCDKETDCPEGYECMMFPCACGCPACEGDDCPECECPPCEEKGECEEIGDEWNDWLAEECKSTSDCPIGFDCEEIEIGCETEVMCEPCACPDCEGEDCQKCECPPCEKESEPCESSTVKKCVFNPKECASDSDCVDGFECKKQEICSGSGGGGSCTCAACVCPPCDGEDCPECDCPEEEEECTCNNEEDEFFEEKCEVIGSYCVPKQIKCTTESDCPKDWECAEFTNDCSCICACTAIDCKEGEDCPPSEECDCPPCECEDDSTEHYCLPDGWIEAGFDQEGQSLGSENFLDDGISEAGSSHDNDKTGTYNPQAESDTVDQAESAGTNKEVTSEEASKEKSSSSCSLANKTPDRAVFGLLLILFVSVFAIFRRKPCVLSSSR